MFNILACLMWIKGCGGGYLLGDKGYFINAQHKEKGTHTILELL
jgi:hypothetical protein